MCGIVGLVNSDNLLQNIINGLQNLEYRGYDSAGVATINELSGNIQTVKTAGKVANLEQEIFSNNANINARTGIGHTRWATHGKPNINNAHPHFTENLALVHNGIIENYSEIKKDLASKGVIFSSDTDTEVIVQLINEKFLSGLSPLDAVQNGLKLLSGTYALGIVFKNHPDMLIATRRGSPLAIGSDKAGNLSIGSDVIALSAFASKVLYLEEGDIAQLFGSGELKIFDKSGIETSRDWQEIHQGQSAPKKDSFDHFMLKEIFEQPTTIKNTIRHYLNEPATNQSKTANIHPSGLIWNNIDHITIVACGTSFYAGLVAKYWFEKYARISVEVDMASEYRYRTPPVCEKSIGVFISQSGETADTLAALRYVKGLNHKSVAIVNVPTSTLAREADVVLPTFAGVEVSVASTKAFTAQLCVLAYMFIEALISRNDIELANIFYQEILQIDKLIEEALKTLDPIKQLALTLGQAKDILYFGRGSLYPIAMEGALKMKELSYIHAEGYAAGEMKHGPIALIEKGMPIIVLSPYDKDGLFHKVISNVCEAESRDARIIVLTCSKGKMMMEEMGLNYETYVYPETSQFTSPLLYSIPIQLIAYGTALSKGVNIDQPRNLAKSVTVE